MWIKICGMTSEQAVEAALQERADALGFVFAPSVRLLELPRAVQLAAPARGRAACVAVTLHPSQALIERILREFAPDVLQTDLADIANLQLPAGLQVLPVVRAAETRAGASLPDALPSRILFEGPRSGLGETVDWEQAKRLATMTQLILAGGLAPRNVAAAITTVRPFGVDVSSGVEAAPGQKDPHRIVDFIRAARAALAGTQYESDRNRS
jgi:phosphoribosylanthranilate isomerase